MKAIDRQFTQLINGSHQFIIPVFQRDYSWTTDECEQMWHDISRAGEGTADSGHFMGSIVYVGTGTAGAAFSSWLVIDGQQRLTTLILLLTALRDHISVTGWTGGDDSPTVDKINAQFLMNLYETEDRHYKLALRRADDATLRALIDGDEPEEASRSELIVGNYDWFKESLVDCNLDALYRGLGLLNIVDVTLDRNTDNPQLIFESMNSTGKDLDQSDLIRNFLLMELGEPEQTRLYEKYWAKIESLFHRAHRPLDFFLRDYIAMKLGSTTQARADRIYDAFKQFRKPGANLPLEGLLEEMTRFAGYYMSLLGAAPGQGKALSDAMRHVRSLGTAHALLGMRLYDCYERETSPLSEGEFVQALHLIESFIVRRGVLELQSRDYWSIFANIASGVDEVNPLESLKVALAQGYRFPRDDQFVKEIQEYPLYRKKRLCWHIITRLENDGQKEPSPVGEYSIEHIMPQSIVDVPGWQEMLGENWEEVHEMWLHRLGNLTLTAYNPELSNRPFEEKKVVFEQGAARLNQYVKQQKIWTEAQMKRRGTTLAKRALEVWPHHGADEKLLREAKIDNLRKEAARRNSDDLDMNDYVRDLLQNGLEENPCDG